MNKKSLFVVGVCKSILTLFICVIFDMNGLIAQNSVSIGTENINENAVLQLVSPNNNQGFLVPRLSTAQRNSMSLNAPADNGMLVYDITAGTFYYWRSGSWYSLSNSPNQNYLAGPGIDISDSIITNTAPDQVVNITGAGSATVTGTYPNFTIQSNPNDTSSQNELITNMQLNGSNVEITEGENLYAVDLSPLITSNTLDGAYNEGGPGAGRTINADNGAVNISGNGGLTVNHRIGVGTTIPNASLHVNAGNGILVEGFGGTIPVEGAGYRMMWYNTAFRSGRVSGTHWDRDSLGTYSMAVGYNTIAKGPASISLGTGTSATGQASFASGGNTKAIGGLSTAMGSYTVAKGENSFAIGNRTSANGFTSIAIGDGIEVASSGMYSIGIALNDQLGTIVSQSNTMAIMGGRVGINTVSPQAELDVNGAIFQRGGILHADYVFKPDYKLESIEEHSAYMWKNEHLKAIPKAKIDKDGNEIVEVGSHRRGIVEELEKAHIYIDQLNDRIKKLEAIIERLDKNVDNI